MSRLGIAGASVAGLGVLLIAGTALPPAETSSPPRDTVAATEAAGEPTGRGGLPHSVPSARPAPTTALPSPRVAEVAATAPGTSPAVVAPVAPPPVAPPPVVRLGQPCDVAGAKGVTADGTPVVCDSRGNSSPRWRKA